MPAHIVKVNGASANTKDIVLNNTIIQHEKKDEMRKIYIVVEIILSQS